MQLEVGTILEGKVTGITKFGVFVELGEGKTGMVHISEVSSNYVTEITDHVKEGQTVKVKVLSVGEDGKIRLPFSAIAGLGEAAAKSMYEKADPNDPYISCDDLQHRTGITKAVLQSLRDLGVVDSIPDTSQMTFF